MATEEINIDTNHEPVDFHPAAVTKYAVNLDIESLHKALKTVVSATAERDAIIGIYASSSLGHPRESWSHRFLSPFFTVAPSLERWAARKHYGNFVIVRETGKKVWEEMPIYVRIGMHLLFFGNLEEKVVELPEVKHLFASETKRQGQYFDSPHSVKSIPPFIKKYHIDTTELAEPDITKYQNFNQFFYRKLKKDLRKIADPDNDNIIVSAADCRLTVFQTIDSAQEYWIKGKKFSLERLFNDKEMAREFDGGSIAIFRLAPQDYHRFHSPVSAEIGDISFTPGTYYTVNPIAINENLDVFTENVRSLLILKSSTTKVAFVAIGALLVGSIKYTVSKGAAVKRGDELGYFAYGGSTVVVVFKKGTMQFDQDLIENSKSKTETLVRVGMRIGRQQ